MKDTPSTRRLVENEVIFRERNERLQKSIDNLNAMAEQDGQPDDAYQNDADTTLSFYCECSDEKCTERVPVKYDDYKEIHKNRRRFLVLKGHEIAAIERVIKEEADYMIIEKNVEPPKHTDGKLNVTELNNT